MLKTIVAIVLIFTTLCILGCGPIAVNMMADNLTDNMLKVMREQAKINAELRKETHQIEGEIKSLTMKDIEVNEEDENKAKVNVSTDDEGTTTVDAKVPTKKIKQVVVVFADGREKSFNGVPSKPLNPGTYYAITFNGLNEVTNVEQRAPDNESR